MKKRGFTLIELLAVILILGIIALIAVPAVTNIINNAKKGAAKATALNYTKAINNQIMLNDLTGDNAITDGVYTVTDLTNKGVEMNGNLPSDNSWVTIYNGEVSAYSLVVNGYVVDYTNTTDEQTIEKGSTPSAAPEGIYPSYSAGEIIEIENEGMGYYFYVMEDSDSSSSTVLLKSASCLSEIGSYTILKMPFDSTGSNNWSTSEIKTYIDSRKSVMESDLGIAIEEMRLLTQDDLTRNGCTFSSVSGTSNYVLTCTNNDNFPFYSWGYSNGNEYGYWTGIASSTGKVYVYNLYTNTTSIADDDGHVSAYFTEVDVTSSQEVEPIIKVAKSSALEVSSFPMAQ